MRGTNDTPEVESNGADTPLVSYIIATYNRVDDLVEAVESALDQQYRPIEVIVVSNSTDRIREDELFGDGGRFDRDEVQYYHFAERMGAPGAKNAAIERASGDIVVQMDDDAVLADDTATDEVIRLFETYDNAGILAFQSLDYYTGEIKIDETPDPPEFHIEPDEQFWTTSFIGMGTAFRREVFEQAGLYPDNFVYGFEEMDLSIRALDAGYDILYTPSVAVYHKKTPEGRLSDKETKERLVENRINIAVRNLPWRYVLFTSVIYSVYVVLLTRSFSSLTNVFRRLYKKRDRLYAERDVVDSETIKRIKSSQTMLFLWWYGPHPKRILGRDGNLSRLKWEV
ncbi:glycosyltransferase family 2 protein [Haloprofundus halophilus]|uniref:glycosyltransferase family 2 protein n=1 Tax=Haloprofundus halophilus TaxID=2283527 RepID=UPI000E44E2FA|nr:glycosyltransferase family 2 protein [Haloprofundus halophilus]